MKALTYKDWVKNPTPRNMWVWDDNESDKVQRKVIYINVLDIPCPVVALTKDKKSTEPFEHCAEIEKPRTRRMTKKELACWLREKPTREYKYCNRIVCSVYSTYTYLENCGDKEVRNDLVIREGYGEWREPLVEVEE